MENSRRNFLKIFGSGVAAAAANPVMSSVSKITKTSKTLRVGLLQPQSNICPQYPYSFVNGFRLGIDQNKAIKKQHVEIVNEPNGYGTPFISKQNAQKLLYENNVDLVVGLLGSEVAGQFDDMFAKKKVPFIVCNAGENYATRPMRDNPYLYFNTLNLLQNNYSSGEYAVNKYGKKGFVITSLYDSGYDALYAFQKGVENAKGTLKEIFVIKATDKDFSSHAISTIEELKPDFVYALLSGDQARDFIIQFKNQSTGSTPLITTPFVTDQPFLPSLGSYAESLVATTPWDRKLNNSENKKFCKNYKETYRSEPDHFAALGYETGLMVYTALANCNGLVDGENLRKELSRVKMKSPRGNFSVNMETGWTETPAYRIEVGGNLFTSLPEPNLIEKIALIEHNNSEFDSLDNDHRSGWLNPYLFI